MDCASIRPNVRVPAESPLQRPNEKVEGLAKPTKWGYPTRAVFGAELRMFAGLADTGRGRHRADAHRRPSTPGAAAASGEQLNG
jgi:hypothetical protein